MSVPAYRRVSDILRKRIASGEYPPGFRLPCERELAEQFGISQITIRHALRILQDHWMVDRRRRVGTTVRARWPGKTLPIAVHDLAGSFRRHAPRLVRKLVESRRAVPVAHIAEALELPEGHKCLFARCLDSLDDQPVVLSRIYIPVDLATTVDDHMLRRVDFLDAWLKDEGLVVSHHAGHVEAVPASNVCVKHLKVEPRYPVLRSMDVLYNKDGRPLAEIVLECQSDCFRLFWTHPPPPRNVAKAP